MVNQIRTALPSGPLLRRSILYGLILGALSSPADAKECTVQIETPMAAPSWAHLERKILAVSTPAARAFVAKYYDERGYFQAFIRWGANDGPDDAFENFAGWPELYALGGSDEILQMYLDTWEGMIRQFTQARTLDVPIARKGMYYKDFLSQSDWQHHGEALRTFNMMGLDVPTLPSYVARARRFAGFYMGEDADAPNYDSAHRVIRSLVNGSRGPMLRDATALDWAGDPFDASRFTPRHGEKTYAQFLDHYHDYTDVVGDHFLNLIATTLPLDAYLLANEPKYKRWIIEYVDAWVDRMKQNGGVIPSYVALDGTIGGTNDEWWRGVYGWDFSPVNPVTGRRENRNRIPRALVGFNNALLITGDQRYVDAWRNMASAINSHVRVTKDGHREYPTMYGTAGWYGWQTHPWEVGALEVWYWSMRPEDRSRVAGNPWVEFLDGHNPTYPETVLRHDLANISDRQARMRRDSSTPETRLADDAMEYNPVEPAALIQLMWGGLIPGRVGGLLNARLRYFDPVRHRPGMPEDMAALVSGLDDHRTIVTLVNLSKTEWQTVIVQAGGYAEHQFLSIEVNGKTKPINADAFTVRIAPSSGAKMNLTMNRYQNQPTVRFPFAG